MSRLRILFITERFPYPLDTGGNVRTFNILKALAAEHAVTLIATTQQDLSRREQQPVAELCRDVRLVRTGRGGGLRDVWRLAESLPKSTPFLLTRHACSGVAREIAAVLADGGADVAHFNHLDAALHESALPQTVLRVVDEHNVLSNQLRTTEHAERSWTRKLVLRYEHRKMTRFEPWLCNRMDACFACSDIDAQSLQALGVTTPITVVPNGVDLDFFRDDSAREPRDLVFVGTLDYDPCEKAVWYFCTEVLPLLHRARPELRFVAVGRNPSPRLRALEAREPRIELAGRVEDVRPYLRRAACVVVPLLSGSGTRLKILEAMAAGAPVVSTTIGAEGIEAVPEKHLLIADDPEHFCAAVLRLFVETNRAERIRLDARRLVEERYGWPSVCHGLLEAYASLARAPARLAA